MQPAKSQILSFRPFLGALLLKKVNILFGAPSLVTLLNHPVGIKCCTLHRAASLPGGEDAKWIVDYCSAGVYNLYSLLPGPGVDSMIDLWGWPWSREEGKKRLVASARTGNIHAIDKVLLEFWGVERGDFGFQDDAFELVQKVYAEYGLMSMDTLESLAFRGSQLAVQFLVLRLSNPRLCNDVARHVFWSFIYCSVYGKHLTGPGERPSLSSPIARFQLGKCFADAPEEFDIIFAATKMCVDPFTPSIMQVAREKIQLYIKDYKEAEEKARTVIDLWSCGMMKQGLIYDVRYLIVEMLWDARWTWTRGWTTHKFFQKRTKTPTTTVE